MKKVFLDSSVLIAACASKTGASALILGLGREKKIQIFEKITQCERIIYPKDAPILAAFLESSCDFLITLDKKHFLAPQVLKFAAPRKVLLPGEFALKYLKNDN